MRGRRAEHLEGVVELVLGQADAALVDELEDVVEVPGGDASEVEHDGHERGVRREGGLLGE